ncbi:LysM peptidoglycan-binding domain-containing protein [Ornithinimicrobium sp. LYQ92]|uniref:LysM peptidoglycan-binding domain-containing protein n=1 Tax=Serinicoccus sp. LYQ92 TaxID=3378798 RepID=UPI003853D7AF
MALIDMIRSVLRGGRHRPAPAAEPAPSLPEQGRPTVRQGSRQQGSRTPASEVEAATPVPAAGAPGQRLRRHTVLPGQTLEEVARQHGVSAAGVAELNGIEQPELIYPGQVFRVPDAEEPQPVNG